MTMLDEPHLQNLEEVESLPLHALYFLLFPYLYPWFIECMLETKENKLLDFTNLKHFWVIEKSQHQQLRVNISNDEARNRIHARNNTELQMNVKWSWLGTKKPSNEK